MSFFGDAAYRNPLQFRSRGNVNPQLRNAMFQKYVDSLHKGQGGLPIPGSLQHPIPGSIGGGLPTYDPMPLGGLGGGRNIHNPGSINPGRPIMGGRGPGWENPGKGGRPGHQLDFITANIKGARAPGKVRKDFLKLLSYHPDAIGLQEMRKDARMALIRRVARNHGYGVFGKFGTPIVYDRRDHKLVGHGAKFLTPATNVGAAGAGPSRLNPKNANWIALKEKGVKGPRGITTYTDVHYAPSQNIPIRNRLARRQAVGTAALQRMLNQRYGQKANRVLLGDMNNSRARRNAPSINAGLRAFKAPSGTHGKSFLDWILSDRNVRGRTVVPYGSDHNFYGGSFGPRRPRNIKRYKP